MTSPILPRSPSATFAPSTHRRSHPNLQTLHHLSLAPLTPKYPIDPADYTPYYDPATAELHTSSSLSHVSGLPSPAGILTKSPARSRDHSRTRLRTARKAKSTVHIQIPGAGVGVGTSNERDGLGDTVSHNNNQTNTKSAPALASNPSSKAEAAAGTKTTHTYTHNQPEPKSHNPQLQLQLHTDPSWLVQTGLSLTESSRETKGQSWISKRDSSTSLAGTPVEGYGYGYGYNIEVINGRRRDGPAPRSGRATPATAAARSRVVSRDVSRNASRTRSGGRLGFGLGDLRMTTTATATSPESMMGTRNASFATATEHNGRDGIHGEDLEVEVDIEPIWADASTRAEAEAEMAAQLQDELGGEFDGFSDGYEGHSHDGDDGDGDPYGILNFEDQDETEDDENAEEEVRRAMRSWRVGGWMDGAIEALLMVEDAGGSNSTGTGTEGVRAGSKTLKEDEAEERRGGGSGGADGDEDVGVEGPEEKVRGAWPDLWWFGRVVRRQVNV